MIRTMVCTVAFVLTSTLALAQEPIPQPTGPVLFCGTQAAPVAESYLLIFDDGSREALTMAGVHAECPEDASLTGSFMMDPSRFDLGVHTVQVVAVNAIGETVGPTYEITVGVVSGAFTVKSIVVFPAKE